MKNEDEVVEMYLAGAAVADICNELNTYPPQVYTILHKNGVTLRGRARQLQLRIDVDGESSKAEGVAPAGGTPRGLGFMITDEELQKYSFEYQVKMKPAKQIAAEEAVPYSRVLTALKNAGVQIVPGNTGRRYRRVRQKIMYDLLETDMNLEQIATENGVNLELVRRIATKAGRAAGTYKQTEWGKKEALIEEILFRLREELGLEQEIDADEGVQRPLPSM